MKKSEVVDKPWIEARISIGGKELTVAQSMTVRVAIQIFAMSLQDGLGEDETGKRIATGYQRAIYEINELLKEAIRESSIEAIC